MYDPAAIGQVQMLGLNLKNRAVGMTLEHCIAGLLFDCHNTKHKVIQKLEK